MYNNPENLPNLKHVVCHQACLLALHCCSLQKNVKQKLFPCWNTDNKTITYTYIFFTYLSCVFWVAKVWNFHNFLHKTQGKYTASSEKFRREVWVPHDFYTFMNISTSASGIIPISFSLLRSSFNMSE